MLRFLVEYHLTFSSIFVLFNFHQFAVSVKVIWYVERFSKFTTFHIAFLWEFRLLAPCAWVCVCAHVCMRVCCGPSGHGQTWLWIQSQQIRMRWRGKLLFSPSFNSSLLVSLASFNLLHFFSLWVRLRVFVCVCVYNHLNICVCVFHT